MGSGRARSWLVGATMLALVAGCTGSDDDAGDDTEVAGAVLERDDEGAPAGVDDPDDERVDPREDAEDAEDTQPDDDADEEAPATDEPATDEPATDEPATDALDESGESGESGESDEDPEPASGFDADPEPTPETETAAPVRPEPASLAPGEGLRGDVVGFGQDGAEVLVGGPTDAVPPPGARSDARRAPTADEVRCETSLQAPPDRGLLARGDLAVDLSIEHHDGTHRRVALLVMDLDVELEPGERFELPPTRSLAIAPDEMASLSCEARFSPA